VTHLPHLRRALGAALVLLTLSGCAGLLRGYARGSSDGLEALEAHGAPVDGRGYFLHGDFGGLSTDALETNALPWKLVAAALVLERAEASGGNQAAVSRRTLDDRLAEFGLLVPESIGNWSGPTEPPPFRQAAGIVSGIAERRLPPIRLEIANLGCAACHAGVTYDAAGLPTRSLWLGLPNTSFDPEAYTRGIYDALNATVGDREALLAAVGRLFPEVDDRELSTLRRHVLPRVDRRLGELRAGIDAPLPFDGGSPGVTHGIAALKLQLGLLGFDAPSGEAGFTSIPELGGRLLRSSLLYDGAYAVPGEERFRPLSREGDDAPPPGHADGLARIVTFFTVPTMGIDPAELDRRNPGTAAVLRFLADYRPPLFPGEVDRRLAEAGAALYAEHCTACHGEHAEPGSSEPPLPLVRFPTRLSPQEEIGTDPERWRAMDGELVRAIARSAYGDAVDAATTGGYVATPLSGLWATAPYLHNGSVPSLGALMHPDERPERFPVGGHALDFEAMGVAYPEGYEPWSTPRIYDTTLPGRGNGGHEAPFGVLSEAEKRALLEYLKLL
jgi:mono/diheme cytochrome c family protein